MAQPDYAYVEGLLRDALDELRNATILLTKGETGAPVDDSLTVAAACLRDLERLFEHDPLSAHAAGRIFCEVLLQRVEVMTSLARAAAGRELAPEHIAALTRTPGLVRRRRN